MSIPELLDRGYLTSSSEVCAMFDLLEDPGDLPLPEARFRPLRAGRADHIGPHIEGSTRLLTQLYPCSVCGSPTNRYDTVAHVPVHGNCVRQIR